MEKPNTPATVGSISRRHFLTVGGLALAGGIVGVRAQSHDSTSDAMPGRNGVFELAPLPYAYGALEPFIDEETMRLHHDKHYAAYTKNLNDALAEFPQLGSKPIEQLLGNIQALPEAIRKTIRNNGGGYYNHSLLWRWMGPSGGEPDGALADVIRKQFGSLDALKKKLSAAAMSVFGSGWAWLVLKEGGVLEIGTTPNQDSPIMGDVSDIRGKPILGIDVWEHAYYLKYKNERSKYLDAWWKVVNWKTVGHLYVGGS